MKSDRKLYLTRVGGQVVEQGDPRPKTLLVGTNAEISAADAKKYDLQSVGGKVVIGGAEPEPEEAAEVAEVEEVEAEETEEEFEEAPKKRAAAAKKPAKKK